MNVDSRALAIAVALSLGAAFSICALALALDPVRSTAAASFVLHIDLTGIARPVSWPSVLIGLPVFALAVGAVAALAGKLYNTLRRV